MLSLARVDAQIQLAGGVSVVLFFYCLVMALQEHNSISIENYSLGAVRSTEKESDVLCRRAPIDEQEGQ